MKRIVMSILMICLLAISTGVASAKEDNLTVENAQKTALKIEKTKQVMAILDEEYGGMNVYYLKRLNSFDYYNWTGNCYNCSN